MRHRLIWIVGAALWTILVAVAAQAVARAWINHDAGWYVHMASVWLNGGVLYRDVVDTNPPLIVALTALPVALGHVLQLPLAATFKAAVFLGVLTMAVCSGVILRRLYRMPHSLVIVVGAILFLGLLYVEADFGQREHLAVLLVTPYVLVAATDHLAARRSRAASVGVGLLAGLGFAMKPHFLLVLVAIEAVLLAHAAYLRDRVRLRPAVIAACVAVLVYGATVVLFVPQYLDVASQVARVYGGLNESLSSLARLAELRVWLVGLVVLSVIRMPQRHSRASSVVFAAATAFLVAALVQMKGWGYHLYPLAFFAGLYFAMVAAALLESERLTSRVRGGRPAVFGFVAVLLAVASIRASPRIAAPAGVEQVESVHQLIEQTAADSIATLSMRTIIFPSFPAVNYTDAKWVMRHNSLWFLPGLYQQALASGSGSTAPHRAIEEMDALERRYFEEVVGDLCSHPPALMMLEDPNPSGRRGGQSLDLRAYYGQDRRFANLVAGYEPVRRVGELFALVRTDGASCSQPRDQDRSHRTPPSGATPQLQAAWQTR